MAYVRDQAQTRSGREDNLEKWYPNLTVHRGHLENLLGTGAAGPVPRVSESGCAKIGNIFGLCLWLRVQSSYTLRIARVIGVSFVIYKVPLQNTPRVYANDRVGPVQGLRTGLVIRMTQH